MDKEYYFTNFAERITLGLGIEVRVSLLAAESIGAKDRLGRRKT